jgi:hypothetical protein
MPALPPYMPRRDVDFDAWFANFSTLLTATPALFGQTAGTAAAVATAYSAWHAAFLLVTSPSTKTATTVSAKNSALVTAKAVVSPVAVNISLNPAVSSGNKIAIGVNPRTSTPTPITPPTTYPIVSVQAGANLQLYVRYRDSAASPSVKAKPYGVQSVQLGYGTSIVAITDADLLPNEVALTKSPFLLSFGSGDGGKQCYLAGRYLLRNGKYSDWGPIINFTVPVAV